LLTHKLFKWRFIMKLMTKTLIFLLMIFASSSFAQSLFTKQHIEVARKCYMQSLNSKNHGVRNSTIFLIVQFKKRIPDENVSQFIKKLKKMSISDPEMLNRLHAYLALVCLENPQLIASADPVNFEDSKTFFNKIYNCLAEVQLAMM